MLSELQNPKERSDVPKSAKAYPTFFFILKDRAQMMSQLHTTFKSNLEVPKRKILIHNWMILNMEYLRVLFSGLNCKIITPMTFLFMQHAIINYGVDNILLSIFQP